MPESPSGQSRGQQHYRAHHGEILATHRNAKLYPKEYANAIPKEWKHLKVTFESVLTEGFPKMFKCDSCEHCGFLFRNSTDKKHGVL